MLGQVNADMVKNFAQYQAIIEVMSKQLAKVKQGQQGAKNDVSNLYLCHITAYFPLQGVIIPRYAISNYKVPLPEEYEAITRPAFSIIRSTVHFSLNSVVQGHSTYKNNLANKAPFIILDKLKPTQKQIVGGYIEDLFCIGHYKLSEETVVLVPEAKRNDEQTLADIKSLPPTVSINYFNGDAKSAVQEFLAAKGADYLDMSGIEQDPNAEVFFGRLGKNYISSQDLMRNIGATFCTHAFTSLCELEPFFSESLIFNFPPFLGSLVNKKLEDVKKGINMAVVTCFSSFNLSPAVKNYLVQYKDALNEVVTMFLTSNSFPELQRNWETQYKAVCSYDLQADLQKPVLDNAAAEKLDKLTGHSFKAYNLTRCLGRVDAVSLYKGEVKEGEAVAKQLSSTFNLKFTFQVDQDAPRIVLKGINLDFIVSKITSALAVQQAVTK